MEIWKEIPGYDGVFSVSSHGRVRNNITGTIRKNSRMSKGMRYLFVNLKKDGKGTSLYIHHLVAHAFHGPTPPGQEIRHRDGNVEHNHEGNLTFGTRAQNLADKQLHGTQTRGEKHQTARLTEKQVLEIRARFPAETQTALAAEFGVALMTVSKIIRRLTWTHII